MANLMNQPAAFPCARAPFLIQDLAEGNMHGMPSHQREGVLMGPLKLSFGREDLLDLL